MRLADAPTPGWFPDPENRSRLRWWDGTDWADVYRAVPTESELARTESDTAPETSADQPNYQPFPPGYRPRDSEQLISEVRAAAREEINRAADLFTARAESAVNRVTPLISDYASTATKWIRRAVIISIILLVAYFVFQVVVQASFFDWLGDRIDNFTDDSLGGSPPFTRSS